MLWLGLVIWIIFCVGKSEELLKNNITFPKKLVFDNLRDKQFFNFPHVLKSKNETKNVLFKIEDKKSDNYFQTYRPQKILKYHMKPQNKFTYEHLYKKRFSAFSSTLGVKIKVLKERTNEKNKILQNFHIQKILKNEVKSVKNSTLQYKNLSQKRYAIFKKKSKEEEINIQLLKNILKKLSYQTKLRGVHSSTTINYVLYSSTMEQYETTKPLMRLTTAYPETSTLRRLQTTTKRPNTGYSQTPTTTQRSQSVVTTTRQTTAYPKTSTTQRLQTAETTTHSTNIYPQTSITTLQLQTTTVPSTTSYSFTTTSERNQMSTTMSPSTEVTTTTPRRSRDSGGLLGLLLAGIVGGTFIILLGTFPPIGTIAAMLPLLTILPATTGLLLLLRGGVNKPPNNDNDPKNEDKDKEKKKKKKYDADPCEINIQQIGDNYPLILMPSDHSKFMYPEYGAKILLEPKDKVTFGCQYADTYSCKNRTIIEKNSREHNLHSMHCFQSVRQTVKTLLGKHGKKSQYRKYQIGLLYGNNFIPTINIYYSLETFTTAFVRTTMSRALSAKQKNAVRQKLKRDHCCDDKDWSEDIYEVAKQQHTFNNLLFCHRNKTRQGVEPCTYLDHHNYLVPTLLAPETNFVYTKAGATSFYYLNSAPQWKSIKNGNWAKIEAHVHKMATHMNKDLIAITGVYGQLKLNDNLDGKKRMKKIFMKYDRKSCGSGEFSVPLYFWKLVYDPSSNTGIVYITVNNPYIEKGVNYLICKNPGHSVLGETPAGWEPDSIKQGFSYMCKIEDFIIMTKMDLVDSLYKK